MSRFIRYFLRGMERGAIAQVDFEVNNLYLDVINMSNDFQVAKRRVIGGTVSHTGGTSGNNSSRKKLRRK